MNFHEESMTKISFVYVNFEKTNFSTFMSGSKSRVTRSGGKSGGNKEQWQTRSGGKSGGKQGEAPNKE